MSLPANFHQIMADLIGTSAIVKAVLEETPPDNLRQRIAEIVKDVYDPIFGEAINQNIATIGDCLMCIDKTARMLAGAVEKYRQKEEGRL